MQAAPFHPAESERLDALTRLNLLDTEQEERFDRITRLAAAVLDVPIALVSLVDTDRQWFKSRVGLDATETRRDVAFCSHAILDPDARAMVVADATSDVRFADNPLVLEEPNIRFYAGQVVRSPNGMPVGTLCVIDRRPRQLAARQLQVLADLGAMVESEFAREQGEALLIRLDESEALKSSILEAMSGGLILQGPDGAILECNPAAERLLGLSGEDLSGRTSLDLRWRAVHADQSPWPGDTHPAMVCLATGEIVRNELMGVHRPDGTLVWLQVSARPTVGPQGARRVLTELVDVTDKRALEIALQASEQAARTSLDALEQGVVLVEVPGIVRRLNPAAERLLGFTAAELAAKWTSGAWESFDEQWVALPRDRGPVGRALAGELVREEIVGWLRKNGERILLRISCVPDADGHGGVLVAFTDVTEERQMLDDLARFRHLFKNANDIITVIDANAQVVLASPSNERVLGYPDKWRHPDGILGLVHPDDVAGAMEQLAQLISGTRGPEPFTVRVKAYNGEWRSMECVGVNLLDEPTVRGIVLTSRDTTERERLTEQLEYLAGHDSLTDLPNRSILESRLEQSLARTQREGTRMGVCFIDLDDFKKVNDIHGHAAGDSVLIEVADRIRAVTRTSDTAVRVGGDEFVVILDPVSGRGGAMAAANRIRDAITTPPITRGFQTVGASCGVAIGEKDEPPESLLIRADTALYRAKKHRNSSVELAPETIESAASERSDPGRGPGAQVP